jgi:hypothetical protein
MGNLPAYSTSPFSPPRRRRFAPAPRSATAGEMCGAPATSRRAAECSGYIVGLAKLPPSATRP